MVFLITIQVLFVLLAIVLFFFSLFFLPLNKLIGVSVKPRENPNFLKKGKMVISVKIQNFSRSRMMKRTSPLELSRAI